MSMVTVHVGLDYHESSVRVCVLSSAGKELANRNVPNDPRAVRDLVLRHGRPARLAIEACCGAADFAAELHELTGWSVRMAHPGYVRRMKRGPDKSDRSDAWLLADLVRVKYLPEVWLADGATRQLRRLVRHRQGLAAERKAIKLRIRALLREERTSCPEGRPWTKPWCEWLRTVSLGEQSRWVLDQEIKRLGRTLEDLQAVERRMAEATREDELTQRLLAEPGIGLVTAVTMRAEFGRVDRFRTGKQLARFCGVTPANASSGQREADAGLVKAGNRELRAAIIEAAKRLPRHVSHWKEFQARLSRTKPANVVTAALANRWLRGLYHRLVAPPAPETVG